MSEKAKCVNCGKEMNQTASPNFDLYCGDEPCRKAFLSNALEALGKPKRKRKD